MDKEKFKKYWGEDTSKLVTPKKRPNPLTTKIAMELIQDLINDESLDLFFHHPKEDLIDLHHTFGRHIRNTYIHTDKHFMDEYPEEHFDEISMEMIEGLHDLLFQLYRDGEDIESFGRERIK